MPEGPTPPAGAPPGPVRSAWPDWLRLAAAFTVVLLHVSGYAFRTSLDAQPVAWWWGNLYNSAARWCVPAFVVISGFLLLAPGRRDGGWEFALRRGRRVLVPLAAWSLIYLVASRPGPAPPLSFARAARALLWDGSAAYHLWFLYMLAGLYALTPLLQPLLAELSASGRRLLCLAALLLAVEWPPLGGWAGGPLLEVATTPPVLGWFVPFRGFYLLGGLLARGGPAGRPAWGAALWLAGWVATVAGTYLLIRHYGRSPQGLRLHAYLSPTVLAMTAGALHLARSLEGTIPPGRLLRRLSAATLGVYLIHPLIIERLWALGWHVETFHPAASVPVLTVAVFALSLAATLLLQALPGTRRLV